jgi:hypothetical protein
MMGDISTGTKVEVEDGDGEWYDPALKRDGSNTDRTYRWKSQEGKFPKYRSGAGGEMG